MNEAQRRALFEVREPSVSDLRELFTIFQNDINPADTSEWIARAASFEADFNRFRLFVTGEFIAMQGGAK